MGLDDKANDSTVSYHLIRPGRHVGWWTEGWSTGGRRHMWTWWPTKQVASVVARMWAAVVRRAGGRAVTIEERAVVRPS